MPFKSFVSDSVTVKTDIKATVLKVVKVLSVFELCQA